MLARRGGRVGYGVRAVTAPRETSEIGQDTDGQLLRRHVQRESLSDVVPYFVASNVGKNYMDI